MLDYQNANRRVGSFERNAEPSGRCGADQLHFAFGGETVEFRLRDQSGTSGTEDVGHAGAGNLLRRGRRVKLIDEKRKMEHLCLRIVKGDEKVFRVNDFLESGVNLVQKFIKI